MPGARCTRSLACKMQKAHELATTVAPGSPRHSRTRMVLTASFVLSPATGFIVTVIC